MQVRSVFGIWILVFVHSWLFSTVNYFWEQEFKWSKIKYPAMVYPALLLIIFCFEWLKSSSLFNPESETVKIAALVLIPEDGESAPMEEYIRWTNDKGDPFDPWIRVHIKAGGKIISVCSESMTIQGKVKEWHDWTGLSFQCSGLYTIEKALSPVCIDLEEDFGEYVEPNVWIIHSSQSSIV